MDWFFIDTHKTNQIRIGWLKTKPSIRIINKRVSAFLSLLPIASTFQKACAGICVVKGPGSFSSIRIGVLCANALARSFDIPLVGVKTNEAENIIKLRKSLVQRIKKTVSYIKPEYDKEPNITAPKIT